MATQNAARARKVEVVDEVKTRMSAATASIVSEYRGLTVAELAELRGSLETAGGDYKIFKNTLVRLAIDGGEYQPLSEYLSGPSALTFVQGDISAVAKALRDFSRNNPLLVIKGGLADGSLLSPGDLAALADLPPREVLLARLAGALAAPMQQLAGLLQAMPRNLAYGISALVEQRQAGGETLAPPRPRTRPDRGHRRDRSCSRSPGRARWRRCTGRSRSGGSVGARRRGRVRRRGGGTARGGGLRRSRLRVAGRQFSRPNPEPTKTARTNKTEGKKGRPGRWQP